MTVWLLGDQLSPEADVLQSADRVLLVEAREVGDRKPYHPQKLTYLFSAMRHARDDLRDRGYEVEYVQADTFAEGLDEYFAAEPGDDLVMQRPPSHGAPERFRELVTDRGGSLSFVPDERFVTTPTDWDEWVGEKGSSEGEEAAADATPSFRQEHWYRHVRRQTGVLMTDGEPAGGEWNYDDQNRETPPDDWTPPSRATFAADELTREVAAEVAERYGDHWGAKEPPGGFDWPVTREQALAALDHFIEHRLGAFGPYQDAMVAGEWALSHSLLSPAFNLGLLQPMEAVEAAAAAYEAGEAPLNSVEGFIRQLIGWREFMRHAYREAMPELAEANQLGQHRALPPVYWDGDTDMTCLSEAIDHVHDRGYAHHIERLMVLSNFALLYGVDPHELNEWFHLGFLDAYHWVTTPNVVGMGTFASDVVSSKPYAASGSYVNRMSDYCASCPYAVSRTTGEGACPFNALYWDFLAEHEATLRGTGRMGLMYSHLDDKEDAELAAIRKRASAVREMAESGEL